MFFPICVMKHCLWPLPQPRKLGRCLDLGKCFPTIANLTYILNNLCFALIFDNIGKIFIDQGNGKPSGSNYFQIFTSFCFIKLLYIFQEIQIILLVSIYMKYLQVTNLLHLKYDKNTIIKTFYNTIPNIHLRHIR